MLPSRTHTFAEALRAVGYRTFGVVTNGHLIGDLGFGQGFDSYRHIGADGWEAAGIDAFCDRKQLRLAFRESTCSYG